MSLIVGEKSAQIDLALILKAAVLLKLTAFALALALTIIFNYNSVLADDLNGKEFIPSIPGVVASFHPSKALFQIQVALLTAFNSIFLVLFTTIVSFKDGNLWKSLFLIGFTRLVSLLSFSLITLQDDPSANINSIALYFLSTSAWMYLISKKIQPKHSYVKAQRSKILKIYLMCFIGTIVFYYKHQMERANYSFSISSFFQWMLLVLDVQFDYSLLGDVKSLEFGVQLGEELKLSERLKKYIV